jgi:glucose-6-phosphate isomerase
MIKMKKPTAVSLNGQIESDLLKKRVKKYADLKNFFEIVDENISDDTVMYEVDMVLKENCDMQYAITTIHPLLVNGQCNMTQGHFHGDKDFGEIYQGISGKGALLLVDEAGNTTVEKVFPGSVHLIEGYVGHRTVNTSDEEALKIGCYWSKHTKGYNRQAMLDCPFTINIYLENGKEKLKQNV